MVETTKALRASFAEDAESLLVCLTSRDIAIKYVAVIAEVFFGRKRSESNLKRLIELPIGTVLIDRALFVLI
jgi:hypothetical protein